MTKLLKLRWLAYELYHHLLANFKAPFFAGWHHASYFKLSWLVKNCHTRWLAGIFISSKSCSLAVKSGYFFSQESEILTKIDVETLC